MADTSTCARAAALLTPMLLGAAALVRIVLSVAVEALGTVRTALADGPTPATLPAAILVAAAGAAALALAWLALVMTVTTLSALTGRVERSAGSSALQPRLAVLVVGAVLGTGPLSTALAVPATGEDTPGPVKERLAGLPLPDRPAGRVASPTGSRARAGTDPTTVVVTAGDSLWSIAERLLPHDAGNAVVDRTWRRLYTDNRDHLGPDPHLIHPGTPLRLPTDLDAPGAAE